MERDLILNGIFYTLRKELGRSPSRLEVLEKIHGRKTHE